MSEVTQAEKRARDETMGREYRMRGQTIESRWDGQKWRHVHTGPNAEAIWRQLTANAEEG